MLTGGSKWHETLHYACTVSDAGSCVGVDRSLSGSFGPGSDEPPKTLTKIQASAVASSRAMLKSRFVSGSAWNRTWWLPKAEVGTVGCVMVELPGVNVAGCMIARAGRQSNQLPSQEHPLEGMAKRNCHSASFVAA
jgi:hypothetical protein